MAFGNPKKFHCFYAKEMPAGIRWVMILRHDVDNADSNKLIN